MTPETLSQLANIIWSICNLLRGPYRRNEYRKVIALDGPIVLMLNKVEEAIVRLDEYRTALITAAVTGKIDVRGWRRTSETELEAGAV
jgi:hypothetical protein